MYSNHVALGIVLLALTVAFLSVGYYRARKVTAIAFWGWGGLAIILSAEGLLILRVEWATTFFTSMAWTGYLLLIDALVWSMRGVSRLGSSPRQFFALAFWSVPLWLVFEAYNLRLANWTYVGLPENSWVRSIGYIWAFATIWPAIFETADFIRAAGLVPGAEQKTPFERGRPSERVRSAAVDSSPIGNSTLYKIAAVGLVMVTLPLVLPPRVGANFFGLVWMGFIPLLDPVSYFWHGRSLLRDLWKGHRSVLYSFLASGWVCGILWEFWNYWATAKWLYVFPILQSSKIFEMPAPGFLGFPPFALECFVMYEFLRTLKNQLTRLRRKQSWEARPLGH
jgi:hypothetical protein